MTCLSVARHDDQGVGHPVFDAALVDELVELAVDVPAEGDAFGVGEVEKACGVVHDAINVWP